MRCADSPRCGWASLRLRSRLRLHGACLGMTLKKRSDQVTDGGIADDIVANAPAADDHFFLVPKVVE